MKGSVKSSVACRDYFFPNNCWDPRDLVFDANSQAEVLRLVKEIIGGKKEEAEAHLAELSSIADGEMGLGLLRSLVKGKKVDSEVMGKLFSMARLVAPNDKKGEFLELCDVVLEQ